MADGTSLTERLQLFMEGNSAITESLLHELLPTLREIAARELKREHSIAPLSKTELIHELWVNNLSKGGWQIHDRGHFFALASLAMRRILVDLARRRLALRRGGGEAPCSLEDSARFPIAADRDAATIVEIGLLMERLDAKYPDCARVVDMHYFSGFTLEEIAREMRLTTKQVRLRWEKGLKWLKRNLRPV
ncbi:MAG TPA: ECF-type sigma factor [Bryobacteraceae bacterium]|jgi:RNA polymerase sigma factor (TIGR02999 family)|nr:ECF-type sigma factor [Bryobacteraceae bacterium]